MAKFPEIPDNDSREKLLEDLEYGGMFGYATARGAYDHYPSTLEFEDAVLRDVMNRAFAIAEKELDAFQYKMDCLIGNLSNGKISKSGVDNSIIESVIQEEFEKIFEGDRDE